MFIIYTNSIIVVNKIINSINVNVVLTCKCLNCINYKQYKCNYKQYRLYLHIHKQYKLYRLYFYLQAV